MTYAPVPEATTRIVGALWRLPYGASNLSATAPSCGTPRFKFVRRQADQRLALPDSPSDFRPELTFRRARVKVFRLKKQTR